MQVITKNNKLDIVWSYRQFIKNLTNRHNAMMHSCKIFEKRIFIRVLQVFKNISLMLVEATVGTGGPSAQWIKRWPA